ncbi:MAG: hypothetical protein KAV68_01045, partial [Dehalococcoidales bacterium]|nr:hypothetical protein [Dehalococcoidales bacterium]
MKGKRLLTLLGSVCLILVLTALPFVAGCPAPEEEVIRIGECMIIEHPDLFADQAGFHEVVDAWAEAEGVTVEY